MKTILFLLSILILGSFGAQAAEPIDWGLGLQDAASPVAEQMHNFHNLLLYIIFGIVIFVLLLLIFVCFRFSAKKNPEPSQTSHNTLLEVIWTAVPVMILVVIAIPSFNLLFYGDRIPEPEMTLKVTGYQWYWGYEYPNHGEISFVSYMKQDEDLKPGEKRLLEVDNRVVLPTDTNIQLLITAGDVLHSFAIPAFGVKTDSVPGRFNETWVNIKEPGVYYGQCSEICGTGHAFMPITIEAVKKEAFAEWVVAQGGSMPEVETVKNEEDDKTAQLNITEK